MTTICVSTWKVAPPGDWTLEQRVNKLKVQLAHAEQWMPNWDEEEQIPYEAHIFIAPEYYLGRKKPDGSLISDTDKLRVQDMLRQVAARHSSLLLIPGTLSWSRTLTRTNPGLDRMGEKKPQERSLEKYVSRYREWGKFVGKAHQDDGLAFDEQAKAQVRIWQAESIKDKSAVRLIKNTALITQSGNNQIIDRTPDVTMLEYDKRYDNYDQGTITENSLGELYKPSATMEVPFGIGEKVEEQAIFPLFVPGRKSPTFTWKGYKVGIEICMDHESGSLRCQGFKDLDVQVVLSATTKLKLQNSAVKYGGLVIHVDTVESPVVYKRTLTGVKQQPSKALDGSLTQWFTSL